jgi:hypothetical protein
VCRHIRAHGGRANNLVITESTSKQDRSVTCPEARTRRRKRRSRSFPCAARDDVIGVLLTAQHLIAYNERCRSHRRRWRHARRPN